MNGCVKLGSRCRNILRFSRASLNRIERRLSIRLSLAKARQAVAGKRRFSPCAALPISPTAAYLYCLGCSRK